MNLKDLKEKCPLPVLLEKLGMGKYAKPSCPSPFREDSKPSWGIFQRANRWMYKDHGTGEAGDEVALLANIYHLDQQKDFIKLLGLYEEIFHRPVQVTLQPTKKEADNQLPDLSPFHPGTDEQLERLSKLRGISLAGLQLAQDRQVLMFGEWHGLEVYGVRDVSGRLGEIRRLDGELFPAYQSMPAHKSHTLKHSQKNWCLGVMEATKFNSLALVEGLPDYLALHQFLIEEDAVDRVGAVAMLGAASAIADDALPYFQSKRVRIFPHADIAGIQAAGKWQTQLTSSKADFFNFRAIEITAGNCIKDLCDFNQQRGAAGFKQQRILENIAL